MLLKKFLFFGDSSTGKKPQIVAAWLIVTARCFLNAGALATRIAASTACNESHPWKITLSRLGFLTRFPHRMPGGKRPTILKARLMKLILEYDRPAEGRRVAWIRRTEKLDIGSSFAVDVQLASDPRLAPLHFSIEGYDGGWRAVAAAPLDFPMLVNGKAASLHELHNGDQIIAGSTQFSVTIEGGPATTLYDHSSEISPTVKNDTIAIDYTNAQFRSGVDEFSVRCNDGRGPQLLEYLANPFNLHITLNEKRLGRKIAAAQKSKDLYEIAPPEIRVTDSLVLVSTTKATRLTEIRQTIDAAQADAASFLVTSLDHEQLLESHRIVWAWLSRPSLLRFQFENGSSDLATRLLDKIECIASIPPSDPSTIKLFCSRSRSQAIADLLSRACQTDHTIN